MSGFELKKAAAVASESIAWSDVNPTVANVKQHRCTSDVTEILSSLFAPVSLLSIHDDVAFYKANDLRTNGRDRSVILKILQQRGDGSKQTELFRLEAVAAAKLSHQNILRSRPPEEFQGVHFSVTEPCPDAETLRSLLDRGGWLELAPALAFIHQIADALEYAHGLGVLHLRLHPENILIDAEGTVLLSDFGIEARPELSWAHRQRAANCPIHYASPEPARGKPLDSRSDLYSLGVVLYQMLTDRLPFDSEDLATVSLKHLTQTPLAPHLYCSDIPLSVSAVVSRLLEKDQDKRFQDVTSFRAELAGCSDRTYCSEDFVEDSLESSLETEDEIDPTPIPLESLVSANREAWEPPTITVIDPPVAESSVASVRTEPVIEREAQAKRFGDSASRRSYSNVLVGNEILLSQASLAQWRPIILVVILAAATFIGLMVLARADSESANRTSPRATPNEPNTGSNESRNPAALAPSKTDANSVSGERQSDGSPPADNPASGTQPSGAAVPASAAARSQAPNTQKSSRSRRVSKPKRRWRQSTRYFREAWRPNRRYYRSGVR
jgi:serine/threonine protein kinase